MRVIGGSAGGQRLTAPRGGQTRPTSDRAREALFSMLADVVTGARVLDLYAGSGALAIEALSRGAASAVCVERSSRAAGFIRDNLARTGFSDAATVLRQDAAAFARQPSGAPFDLVLADPPYAAALPAVYRLIDALHRAAALAGPVTVAIERDRRDPELGAPPPPWLAPEPPRAYGDTVLLLAKGASP